MEYFLFTFDDTLKGFTIQPTIHFCSDCGYIGLVIFRYEVKLIFYAS
jgi:hypothetical protein